MTGIRNIRENRLHFREIVTSRHSVIEEARVRHGTGVVVEIFFVDCPSISAAEVFVNFFDSLRKPPDEIINLPVKIGSSGGNCFQVPFWLIADMVVSLI